MILWILRLAGRLLWGLLVITIRLATAVLILILIPIWLILWMLLRVFSDSLFNTIRGRD